MNISQLIERLQIIEEEYGDLPVVLSDGFDVVKAEVIEIEDGYNAVEVSE